MPLAKRGKPANNQDRFSTFPAYTLQSGGSLFTVNWQLGRWDL